MAEYAKIMSGKYFIEEHADYDPKILKKKAGPGFGFSNSSVIDDSRVCGHFKGSRFEKQ